MAADSYKKGQVIQIARGNLETRLQNKPLAKGELFLHITKQVNATRKILDLVTNSTIKTIFTGDLFAGANSSTQVYYIGSGGSLKWGGISYATNWDDAQLVAKNNPNFIYMYCGNGAIYKDDQRAAQQPDRMTSDTHNYVASSSDEWASEINPGDLFFYSPVCDHIVVFSLNRATDALTKINVGALVSDSMQNWLKDQFTDTDADNVSTLKDFLDGPVRHYQYLIDTEGWNKAKAEGCEVVRDEEKGTITVNAGTVSLAEDGDGFIHYVPFATENPGLNKYIVADSVTGIAGETVREGDLILTIPNSTDGGVHHAVVSLYGALLDKLQPKFDGRADTYATAIWEKGIDGEYVGDKAYFAKHDQVADFLDRLFKTKVDIDPVTHKIISSQLPDYLLGATKYMGKFSASTEAWKTIGTYTTAKSFAEWLLDNDTNSNASAEDWENLDKSEDDTSGDSVGNNVAGSKELNDKLKAGCYWIYTGETADIEDMKNLFNLYEDKDDYDTKSGAEIAVKIAELKATLETQVNARSVLSKQESDAQDALDTINDQISEAEDNEEDTSDLESQKSAAQTALDSVTTALAAKDAEIAALNKELAEYEAELVKEQSRLSQHLLNKGDWIVYNGETGKFDIIDNTSSFIGLLVHGVKVAGVVEFKDKERVASTTTERYINGTKQAAATFQENETVVNSPDDHTVEFKNPASVLFRSQVGNTETVLTDSKFIPIINGDGWAYSSRFEFIKGETGLKVAWGDSTSPVTSVSFTLFKEGDTDKTDYTFHDTLFKKSSEEYRAVDTKRIKTDTADGFDFEEFNFAPSELIYNYSMKLEKAPELYLPQYSGVLTTEDYVNNGFTVIKAIIEDLYDTILDETTKGHIDWLQTVRLKKDADGKVVKNDKGEDVKEIYDSQVLQELEAGTKLLLKLFYDKDSANTGLYDENKSLNFASLSTYKKLTKAQLFEVGLAAGEGALDYKLGAADGEDAIAETLNPSEALSGVQPENILPNHSGILLNNNSVIDGGEWL